MKKSALSRIIAMAICLLMVTALIPAVPAHAAVSNPQLTASWDDDYEEVVLEWTAAGTYEEIYRYEIYRAKDVSGKAGTYKKIDTYSGEGPFDMTDWGVDQAKTYWYKVTALDYDRVKVAESKAVKLDVPLVTPSINRIVHDAATGGPMICTLYWEDADRFDVYRSKSKTGTYSKIGSFLPDTRYVDKTAASGTTYYYKIKACAADSKYNSLMSSYKSGKKVKADAALAEAIKGSTNSKGNLIEIATLDKTLSQVSKIGIGDLPGFNSGYYMMEGSLTMSQVFNISKIKNAGGSVYDTGNSLGDPYYSQTHLIVKKNGYNYNEMIARTYGINVLKVSKDSTTAEINTLIKSTARKYYSDANWTVTSSKYSPSTIKYSNSVLGDRDCYVNYVKKAGYGNYTSNSYFLQIKNKNSSSKKGWAFVTVVPTLTRLSKPVITISNLDGTPDMKVSWKKVSGANKYEVWKKVGTNGTYKKVKTTTSVSYKDTTTVKGKKYYYKVKAIKTANSTQNSYFSGAKYLTCK